MVEAFDAALLDALEDDSPPRVAQAELAPPEPPPEPQTGGPLGRWASLLDKIIGA